ncbi:MAG: hypothetical protein WDN27_04485 [Candidatus Saccharibacteria bacterium]
MLASIYYLLASTYGSGPYNGSNYNGTSSGSSNLLTNTGFDIIATITLACVILLIALVIRIWRRPKTAAGTTAQSSSNSTNE